MVVGLLALEAAVAAAGAMVYVNTVVLIETQLALGAPQVALARGALGVGHQVHRSGLAVEGVMFLLVQEHLVLRAAAVFSVVAM